MRYLLMIGLVAAAALPNQIRADEAAETQPKAKRVAYVGVIVQPLHAAFWSHLKDVLTQKQGVIVRHVAEDSPAAKAGLKEHDILMTYGNHELKSPKQLVRLIQISKTGETKTIGLIRGGKKQQVSLTLGEQTVTHQDAVWSDFETISLSKGKDGKFTATIEHRANDGEIVKHRFTGAIADIRDQIKADKDLPDTERDQLLKTLIRRSRAYEHPTSPSYYYGPYGPLM